MFRNCNPKCSRLPQRGKSTAGTMLRHEPIPCPRATSIDRRSPYICPCLPSPVLSLYLSPSAGCLFYLSFIQTLVYSAPLYFLTLYPFAFLYSILAPFLFVFSLLRFTFLCHFVFSVFLLSYKYQYRQAMVLPM